MVDAGSSMRRFSVLLSTVEKSIRTQAALKIAQWVLAAIISMHVRTPRILATATIQGQRLFRSESRLCGYYLRAVSNWRNTVIWRLLYVLKSLLNPSQLSWCLVELLLRNMQGLSYDGNSGLEIGRECDHSLQSLFLWHFTTQFFARKS